MKTSIANSKSPRSNRDVQRPTMETTKSRPRSLKNGACISIVLAGSALTSSRPPRALASGLPSPAAVFLQPFKSNFIPDPEGTISFALSPLLRDLFEVALLPACDISLIPCWVDKRIGLTGQHLRYLASISKNGACGPRNTSHGRTSASQTNSRMPSNTSPRRVVDHAHSRFDRHAPGKNYIELLAVLKIVVVHVVLPSV